MHLYNDSFDRVAEMEHKADLELDMAEAPLLDILSRSGDGRAAAGSRDATKSVDGSDVNVAFAIISTVIVALGPLSFGVALGYTSPTLDAIADEIRLTTTQMSLFGALVNVGAMAGAITSGKFADSLGRRAAILFASFVQSTGWCFLVYSQKASHLYTGRLLIGYGIGMMSFTVPVYIAEISPSHLRGRLGAVNQLAITVGIMLVYGAGVYMPWRTLAAIAVAPLVALMLCLILVPETPRWLAMKGESENMAMALKKLRGTTNHIMSDEMDEITEAVASYLTQPKAQIKDLFSKGLTRPLLVCIGLFALQQFSGINAIMFYSQSIFKAVGFGSANVAALSVSVLQVVMTVVATALMDKVGRRVLMIISTSGLTIGNLAMAISFLLRSSVDLVEARVERGGTSAAAAMAASADWIVGPLAVGSLLMVVASFSLGMGAIPWILMSEVFPGHVRGLAGSFAVLINWLCSFIVTVVFQSLLSWSASGSFFCFAAECACAVLFVLRFVPETKGRTLEQIQASFKTS